VVIPAQVIRVDEPVVVTSFDLRSARKEAVDFFKEKQYRKARELINRTLVGPNAKDPILLHILSKIQYENANYDTATEIAEKAIHGAKLSSSISSMEITHLHLHYARCLFGAGQFEEADVEVDRFFDTIGGFDTAVRAGGEVTALAFEGLALHGECIFEIGRVSEAANVINHGLSAPGAEDNAALLRAYSHFALKYDKLEDALRSLLKLMAADKNNKRSKQLLAQALRHGNALELLYQQLAPTANTAPAYAFLANIAKVCSLVLTISLTKRNMMLS
jgi:predicted Zn-dependent protease